MLRIRQLIVLSTTMDVMIVALESLVSCVQREHVFGRVFLRVLSVKQAMSSIIIDVLRNKPLVFLNEAMPVVAL